MGIPKSLLEKIFCTDLWTNPLNMVRRIAHNTKILNSGLTKTQVSSFQLSQNRTGVSPAVTINDLSGVAMAALPFLGFPSRSGPLPTQTDSLWGSSCTSQGRSIGKWRARGVEHAVEVSSWSQIAWEMKNRMLELPLLDLPPFWLWIHD